LEHVKILTQQVVGKARTRTEAAQRIAEFLRKNYRYTLDIAPLKADENPLEVFLFKQKKGHCEYFASAMAVMLRQAGIPSRVVTGFLSEEWNTRGHYFVVRMKDAHAWVEASVESDRWVSFDPSPRDLRSTGDPSALVRRMTEAVDYLNLRWNRYILSYDLQQQMALVRAVTQESNIISLKLEMFAAPLRKIIAWRNEGWRPLHWKDFGKLSFTFWLMVSLGGVAAVATGALLLFSWRRLFRKDRVWFYRPFIRVIERRAGSKKESQTLREFLEGVAVQANENTPDVRFLEETYYRLRFDPLYRPPSTLSHAVRTSLKRLRSLDQ
jgi:hypothetical protein